MKFTKSIFLFLLLLFPVLIYLFLQGFGENRFEIPLYYESGLDSTMLGCDENSGKTPYQLDLSNVFEHFSELVDEPNNQSTVYFVGDQSDKMVRNNILTFLEKYKNEDRGRLLLFSLKEKEQFDLSRYKKYKSYQGDRDALLQLGRCLLQVDLSYDSISQSLEGDQLILVDGQHQIRGYYDPYELTEIDRLNTELYILLNE